MSGDHLERLRAWRAISEQNRPGYDHMRDISYEKAPVCDADVDATLAELERLRAEQALLARRLRHAYRAGFDDRHWSALTAIGFAVSNIESRAKRYATRVIVEGAEVDFVQQQPEGGSDADGAQ